MYSNDARYFRIDPLRFSPLIKTTQLLAEQLKTLHTEPKLFDALAAGLQGQFKAGRTGKKAIHKRLRQCESSLSEVLQWLLWAEGRVRTRSRGTSNVSGSLPSLLRRLSEIMFEFKLQDIGRRARSGSNVSNRAFALRAARIVRPTLTAAAFNKAMAAQIKRDPAIPFRALGNIAEFSGPIDPK
jgi:hypothetical protein